MNSFIEILNGRGETFLTFVWPMLWQSSLLIAVLLTFDFLVRRKVRASVRYTLWLVVLVKLCLPPTLALPTSPAWWLHKTPAPVAAKPEIHYTVTYDNTPLSEMPTEPLPVYVPPKPSLTTATWLLSASVLVSSSLLLWLLVRWWQITRLVRRAAASEKLTALADEAQQIVGMKMKVRVKLTTNAMSPAVCGLFRPAILIPQPLAENFSDEQMRAVLLHELIHLRRRDVWMNFLQALLQIIYWWHPLVWLANARIRRVREEAVDDAVMLALHDGAEAYAPTLLEVAKLALNRPLVSLGLVGIMESRNALRQRIERLLDFHPPRQAGLTLVSLVGVLAFTAVAVPMGERPVPAPAEAPAAAENPAVTVPAATDEQSLTVKVDREIFIRNVKAQAGKYLLAPTNDYTVIFMEALRSEGLDCNPPHGLAYNNETGEITTQNTPEKLELFRQVVDQLNRADGICELPLHNSVLRQKAVVIQGAIYKMREVDFQKITSGLRFYPGDHGGDSWWSVAPDKFKQLTGSMESSGLLPIQRPRVQTGGGRPAQFFVGDENNSVEFDCIPFVKDGFVDLTLQSTVITSDPAGSAFTNQFNTRASAEDYGGIVTRLENFDGHAGSNLVVVIGVQILTNSVAPHFQQRLQTIIKRAPASTPVSADPNLVGLITDPNFRVALREFEKRNSNDTSSGTPPVQRINRNHSINRVETATQSIAVSQSAAGVDTNRPQVLITAYFCEALTPDLKEFEKSLRFNVDTAGQNLWVPLPASQFGTVYNQTKASAFHRLSTPRVVTLSGEAAQMSMGDGTNATDFDCTPVITNGQVNLTFDFRVVRPQAGGLVTNRFHTVETLESRGGILVKSADAPGALQSNVMVLARVEIITDASVRFQPRLQKIIKPASQPEGGSKATNANASQFVERFRTIINRAPHTNGDPAMLYSRMYRVDKKSFLSGLKQMGLAVAATNSSAEISGMARNFFTSLGVDLDSPAGKAVFFNEGYGGNEGNGMLFVKATQADQDTIDRGLQRMNQIHIKARFLEVPKGTLAGMKINTLSTNSTGAGLMGILSDANFRVALRTLESAKGFETLGEPEVTTMSGRQCQIRTTQVVTVVTNVVLEESATNGSSAITFKTGQIETGPIFDVTPKVMTDGYTIHLPMTAMRVEFWGYATIPTNDVVPVTATNSAGEVIKLPMMWPAVQLSSVSTRVDLLDNQTAIFSLNDETQTQFADPMGVLSTDGDKQVRFGDPDIKREAIVAKHIRDARKRIGDKEIIVFVTATIVDPAGNRVHTEEEASHFQIKAAPDTFPTGGRGP